LRQSRLTLEEFLANPTVVDAVLYNFIIIGEASANIPDEIQKLYPTLPWSKMRGMRNVVAHQYHGGRLVTIWETAIEDLPALRYLVERLLNAQES
jgi:uncharacterized protein with HEPN domain